MMFLKKLVLGSITLAILGAVAFAVPTIWGRPPLIEIFYGRVFLTAMLDHPQMLSTLGLVEQVGIVSHNAELEDYSPEADRRDFEKFKADYETLHRYERASLDDQTSYDILDYFLKTLVDGGEFMYYDYPVNQFFGFQSSLPDFMVQLHRVDNERGAAYYLARLGKFGTAFDQTIESVKLRESKGIQPPKFVMTHVLKEMRAFIDQAPTEHVLYTNLQKKLDALDGLSDDRKTELLATAARTISDVVYPAYQRLIDHYAAIEPTASTDAGVWKLPNGDAYYAYKLRESTTTDMSAEEIHAIGAQEVRRLQGEMKAILLNQGYSAEDFAATMQALNTEKRFLYPDTDAGRQQVLDDYRKIIEEIEAGMGDIFAQRPSAKVEVRRVPEFKEETSSGAYYQPPALDGSRPGVFYANLRSVKDIPKFGMRTLAYHEAIPGHHYQFAVAQQIEGVPFFRKVLPFTAYSEGWALYAEQVAAENGFQDDPFDRLGYLTAQLFRACRLVVDTGIHHKRWTRERAIETMQACTGMPEKEVIAEVERYIVWPGQACAYMVGRLEIERLREEARVALGDKFDIRDFHDVVLGGGSMPLTVLRRRVEAWYSGARAVSADKNAS